MLFDPFRLTIALVPLLAYLAVIGFANLRQRPFMTNGTSDLAVLGIALTGLAVVGPIELLMPEMAAIRFGNFVWLFLLVFYWLCLSLVVLLTRPRIIVYNITPEELRPKLADVVSKLDNQARWAGDALMLPSLGMQLHMDTFAVMRCVSLVSSGSRQNLQNWRRFESVLAAALREVRVPPNPRAVWLLASAVFLTAGMMNHMLSNPLAVAQAMREMMR